MTTINRPVSRKTRSEYRVLYQKGRKLVVTIKPGDILEFHELGRRGKWGLAIDTAFRYAVYLRAMADAYDKRKAKGKAK